MKKLLFLSVLILIPFINNAQSKSKRIDNENKKQAALFDNNTIEIFIEVEAEEYYEKGQIKVNIITGEDYKFLLKKKEDLSVMKQLKEETMMINNMADLLGYLSGKGFKIINFTAFMMDGFILNKIVLSRQIDNS